MFYAIQQDDKYVLRFRYDPNLINLIKQVPGRQWHPDGKYWDIPSSHLGFLMKVIQGTAYEHALEIHSDEHIDEDATIDSTKKIPDIDISDIDLYVKDGFHLYSHQLDFLRYAKHKNLKGFILADDMGCLAGDTKLSLHINGANAYRTIESLYKRYHRRKQGNYGEDVAIEARCTNPDFHDIGYERVLDVVQSGVKSVYLLELADGKHIKLTSDHMVLTTKGFKSACDLRDGDTICVDGSKRCKYVDFVRLVYIGAEMTYDMKLVGPYHNFLANGMFVHNCGKTLELMNFALYQRKRYRFRHCLIITCVNSAKYSWQADIFKHTNGMEQAYILGSRLIKRGKRKGQVRYNGSGQDKVDDLLTGHMYGDENAPELPFFLVTNIESIGRTTAKSPKGKSKKFILEDALVQMIQDGSLSMIAIDEAHKNMSPKSTQGKVILDIKKQTGKMIQWIPMTGTPIKNKPLDVFTPLKLVDGHEIKSFFEWSHIFCIFGGYGGYEIMGYKNIPMLKDMLQNHMIRRMKSEVLDLPSKIYYNEYVDNTPYQQNLYDALEEEIYENKEEILKSLNPLSAMLRLRQVNGSPELVDDTLVVDDSYLSKNAKLTRLLEIVDDIIERDEKVIVFSNWVEPLRTIYKFMSKKCKTCCYTGTMSEAEREKHKNVFINNPDYKVMLGTIGAMGVSVTLTVATNVIFYDDCWTSADKVQAEDRTMRIGQTNSVNIYTIMAKDTVDERVRDIIEQKKGIASFIVDNSLDMKKNPKLFDFLLGRD
jgi:hypothetical protein